MKEEMDFKKLSKASFIAGTSLIIMTILSFIIFPSLQANPFSITGISIIIILDIVVALALYFLLKPVSSNLSLLMSLLRIIYAIIFGIALLNISELKTFFFIWDIGLIIFGIHIFLLGYLIIKSVYIPKILGVLVMIGSSGYIIDSIAKFIGYTSEITMFTFFGEVLFALWLVIKGGKIADKKSIS